MLSGSVLGTIAMLKELKFKMQKELNEEFKTSVITGGLASKELAKYIDKDLVYNENLLLEGLNEIYLKN